MSHTLPPDMNSITAQPTSSGVSKAYQRLSAGPKLILRVKSLLFLPTGKTVFLQCLARSRLRAPDGKAWSSQKLNVILDDLLRQKLLTDDLACPPELLHAITVDAIAAEGSALLIEAASNAPDVLRGHSYSFQSHQSLADVLRRQIRLALYTNDEKQFVAKRDAYEKSFASHSIVGFLGLLFSGVSLETDWLTSCPVSAQVAILQARLSTFLGSGVPAPDLPALVAYYRARQDADGFATVRPILLYHDLLAGRIDNVRQGCSTIRNDTGSAFLAMEAALAFLAGDNQACLRAYREALKQRRRQLGKRKLFLDDAHGLFFLMAMLQTNDASLHGDMQAAFGVVLSDPSTYGGGFLALQALFWSVQGLETKAAHLLEQLHSTMPEEPLSAACVALASYLMDAALTRKQEADLVARFERLKDVLPLVARIHAEILAETGADPARYRAYLAATGDGIGLSFTKIIQARQPWERALESLDSFLGSGSTGRDRPRDAVRSRRLAWFLDLRTLALEVAEQSIRKDGWSDGRPVAMKRLHDRDPRLDYLTEQDRTALRALRKVPGAWYGEETYAFDTQRAVPALVGHPVVFDALHRSRRIELVHYALELVVADHRMGYRIALSHAAEAPTIFLEAETPTRYRVIEFPQRMLAIQEMLGRSGLVVPREARERVIALVERNSPGLPIRAEITALAQAAREGQSAPVVQLVPEGAGLRVSLVVRPFGPDGPAFVALLGSRSVLASLDGEQVRANRDLQREMAERTALVEACPTLRDRLGPEAHEVVIDDLDGSLELLLELQACPGPLSIEWPAGKAMQISRLTPDRLRLKVGQDRDWFKVDGDIAIDEEQVLEMRFLLDRLDRAQGRFVPLGDGRFIALTRQLQAQLEQLAAVSEPHRTGCRVHALGAPALRNLLENAEHVDADKAWTRHVARIRTAEGWAPKLPSTLQAELRDYQVEGFMWLSRLAHWGAGACLADDMGLGKTVQTIAVILDRAGQGPCLVVAPTSVCANWESEIGRFAPTLVVHRLSGASDRRALIAALGPRDVMVCSYGLLHQEAEPLGSRLWPTLVLDEAQAIKNAGTKRAQASVGLQAGFRLALTGTPVENYLDELWSLFNFVAPGLLGSRERFQKRFAMPIERDGDVHARQALRTLVQPFLLRRTKSAVLSELPPRIEQTIQVEMDASERSFYEALRQRALDSIEAFDAPAGKRKLHILSEITRLRRACCNPALIDAAAEVPSAKLDALLDLVDELIRNRHRALVFSQFVGHLALVRTALDARSIRYEYLDGSTPATERERSVAAFQSGSADLFLISLRAGGTGLNLTAADYVVHLDPWWNPAVEDQASDRAHRIGQMRPVTIYRLIMRDSIEESIVGLHRDKRDLAAGLLEGTETSARLSEEALLELIRR